MTLLRGGSYIFDPRRNAVLLVAGDKAGRWEAWYRQAIPLAEPRTRGRGGRRAGLTFAAELSGHVPASARCPAGFREEAGREGEAS